MKKTIKSVNKWRRSEHLSPGDNRRLDDLVRDLKAGAITVGIVILVIWILLEFRWFI